MARQKKVDDTPKTQPTSAEMRDWYTKNRGKIEKYASAQEAMKRIRDVTKSQTKSISAFNKETLRSYLKNIGSNEANLRNLSRYLYYRSQVYRRLIMFNAGMLFLDARSVIPNYSLTEENNADDVLKSYEETIDVLDHMGLEYEMTKASMVCKREDVFYGCAYYTEGEGLFIYPLDPDYCRISGFYPTGDLGFSMNMSYFSRRQTLLEYLGEPFQSMWKEYQKDTTNNKWQDMPDEYCVCFKDRAEDLDVIAPPFSGIFNALISLLDLEDIQSVEDEQAIYKLLWVELETLTGATVPDDWKVDPSLMIDYFNKMVDEALPDYVSAAIVPGKLEQINFDTDHASDTTKVQKATQTLLNSSGGSQILNSSTISGTTAFTAAIKSDTLNAIKLLLPQIEGWVNRFISYHVSNPAKVKFFEVSYYTKDEFKKDLIESAQYGLPTALAINSLNGFSEKDTMALNFLEQDVLKISEKFKPLQSTHTQSSNDSGGQTKDVTELTDEGEATREDSKNDK